ncbi:ArnT family glycosyltransferase [Prochlorococcus marinus]|uniref:ArnT family glycosyltransferase n=1 Tax=Prochlorococcus marinus TaxID=1219 RepID=UPI00214B9CC2|nr:hypothetical protein [Prochlorococcus marinus]
MTERVSQNYRPPILWIFLFWTIACVIAFISLGNLPLRDFDEATVARVALELNQKSGLDRLLPSIWDEPYLNKPPGLHWIISFAIWIRQKFQHNIEFLPSEFCIRFFPALFSTFVVPLGGLIQWNLRPKDRISCITTSAILLTLLPIVRYGRMAMLDGTQLSAIAFLWFCLSSIENNRSNKVKFLGAGFACSFMLLLKAPVIIPALLASLLPLIWENRSRNYFNNLSWGWFFYGLIPGFAWHLWNVFSYGSGALWMWWGDGAGRVLFKEGSGSELGFLVPVIEIFEGGWPWILVWPIGVVWAFSHLHTRWGTWAFSTQIIIAGSILPLKLQLPWYIHPFWLPFALLCGPPIAWLINRKDYDYVLARKILSIIPYVISFIGLSLLILSLLLKFNLLNWGEEYFNIIFSISSGWLIGARLLSNSRKNIRKIGFLGIILGSVIGLIFFVSSKFWLWEINENWDVRPVAELISDLPNQEIYIGNSFERPSLNWYAQKQIKSFDKKTQTKCKVIKETNDWDLYTCNE